MVRRLRFFASVSLVLAACVGDDPASSTPVGDAGGAGDSATPPSDSGSGDSATSTDGGIDAPSECLKPAADMISWWTGDDTLADKLGVNNMAIVGDAGTVGYAPGQVGNAFSFNRTARLERNAPINMPTTQLSVEGWVKRDADASERFLDHSTAGSADGWNFDVWETKLRLQVIQFSASSNAPMPVGAITHVAATFDGRVLRVYINGQEDGQTDLGANQPLPTPTLPLRIGGASDTTSKYGGFIDELALYSRALLPPEIAAIHAAGPKGRCKN